MEIRDTVVEIDALGGVQILARAEIIAQEPPGLPTELVSLPTVWVDLAHNDFLMS